MIITNRFHYQIFDLFIGFEMKLLLFFFAFYKIRFQFEKFIHLVSVYKVIMNFIQEISESTNEFIKERNFLIEISRKIGFAYNFVDSNRDDFFVIIESLTFDRLFTLRRI